ncbi:MAG: fumarylacetoacetate hydrolase family protein [Planctomycetota bacterium]
MQLELDAFGAFLRVASSPAGDALRIHQIVAIGLNYAEHAREQKTPLPERPMVFTKSSAAVILDGDDIVVPKICQDRPQVDYEGELAVVIGKRARDVTPSRALEHVLGYTIANDVSARWWQKEGAGKQFYRGKSFDTFCPLLRAITPAARVPDPQALRLSTRLNGETVQDGATSDMIFDVRTLIAELSRGATLLPGTVILTGTPSGVGAARDPQRFLVEGDVVSIEISGLGVLTNRVRYER